MSKKVIQPKCPHCLRNLREKVRLYGQTSYSCTACGNWGPWKSRITERIRPKQ